MTLGSAIHWQPVKQFGRTTSRLLATDELRHEHQDVQYLSQPVVQPFSHLFLNALHSKRIICDFNLN